MNAYFKRINDYYDQSLEDYKLIWNSGRNYALHAGFYDDLNRSHNDALLNMNGYVAETAGIKRDSRVLDAGCGIGGTSIWMAKHLQARVTGININPEQIELGKSLAAKEEVSHLVDFKVADYHHTGFKAASMDSVIAIESVCHSEDKPRFLKEAYRVLKKGGTIVITDGFRTLSKSSSNDEAELRKWLDGWSVDDLASVEDFRKYLKESGFRNIRIVDITKNVMKSSMRLYIASIINYPIAKILEFIGLRTKVQTGNLIGAYYQYRTLKREIWKYCICYAEK